MNLDRTLVDYFCAFLKVIFGGEVMSWNWFEFNQINVTIGNTHGIKMTKSNKWIWEPLIVQNKHPF